MQNPTRVTLTVQLHPDILRWLEALQGRLQPRGDLSAVVEAVLRDAMTVLRVRR